MNILMVAAENGALPGGKVGGLGDVIREAPIALANAGHKVSIVTPDYGSFIIPKKDPLVGQVEVDFSGKSEHLALHHLKTGENGSSDKTEKSSVTHFAFSHSLFFLSGKGQIYSSDLLGPFATDAHKFSFFSAAVCQGLVSGLFGEVDVIHCHDWHTASVLLLRNYHQDYEPLKKINAVYSIHNIAYQGVRPFRGDSSSLESWFPELNYEKDLIQDPTHSDCVNLMRAGINLADKVHTVSPTYAKEILRSSDPALGFVGGEGLESDLKKIQNQGNLLGILNGCAYHEKNQSIEKSSDEVKKLWREIDSSLKLWTKSDSIPQHYWRSYYFSLQRVKKISLQRKPIQPLLVSVGRLTDQKIKLLAAKYNDHTVLDEMLTQLGTGHFILLGSGDEKYEQFLIDAMSRHENFLFLCGFSENLSGAIYDAGDLFVMPSSFEPCGISQLFALRAGMPCLVHSIGGLKDTITDGETGFIFDGNSEIEQTGNLLKKLTTALNAFHQNPKHWGEIKKNALAQRFTWNETAKQYIEKLYK